MAEPRAVYEDEKAARAAGVKATVAYETTSTNIVLALITSEAASRKTDKTRCA